MKSRVLCWLNIMCQLRRSWKLIYETAPAQESSSTSASLLILALLAAFFFSNTVWNWLLVAHYHFLFLRVLCFVSCLSFNFFLVCLLNLAFWRVMTIFCFGLVWGFYFYITFFLNHHSSQYRMFSISFVQCDPFYPKSDDTSSDK